MLTLQAYKPTLNFWVPQSMGPLQFLFSAVWECFTVRPRFNTYLVIRLPVQDYIEPRWHQSSSPHRRTCHAPARSMSGTLECTVNFSQITHRVPIRQNTAVGPGTILNYQKDHPCPTKFRQNHFLYNLGIGPQARPYVARKPQKTLQFPLSSPLENLISLDHKQLQGSVQSRPLLGITQRPKIGSSARSDTP